MTQDREWGAGLRPGPIARMFMPPSPETEMRRALQRVRVRRLDTDSTWREFLGDVAVRLDRIERQAIPVVAIALREDLWLGWPDCVTVLGYPLVRLAADSPTRWGVIT